VVELDTRDRNLLAGRVDPEEFASMGSSRRPAADHLVPFGYLIFQREASVGERCRCSEGKTTSLLGT
jgi:hypothetical protein